MMYEYEYEQERLFRGFSDRDEIVNCEICRTQRIAYNTVEADIMRHELVGGEEVQVPAQNLMHNEVDYFYFGDMDDLRTGKMLWTGDIAPKDEMRLLDYHQHHRDVTNVQDYIRGQIECDRRIKQLHNHGHRYLIREGPTVEVNWEYRVTGDRDLAVWYNTNGNIQPRYMTTTTADTTSGTLMQWNFGGSANTSAGGTTTGYWNVDTRYEGPTLYAQREFTAQINIETENTYQLRQHRKFSERAALDEDGKLKLYEVKCLINKVFMPVPRKQYLAMKPEHKLMVQAKNKSEKLLKQWLSPNEYKSLKNLGELRIQDLTDDDTIYIIKKDPNRQVDVEKKGKLVETWCLVADKLDMPVGDQLLSKVMRLKADQAGFKKIAIKTKFCGSRIKDEALSYEGKIMPINIITRKTKVIC